MSMIINKGTKSIEYQSHRVYPENWNGDNWIAVPPELDIIALENAPYCDLEIQDNVLVGITPTENPDQVEPEEPVDDRQAVEQEITDLMLADMEQGQFATALQLQLMEVTQRV